jgi:hypothetical protein
MGRTARIRDRPVSGRADGGAASAPRRHACSRRPSAHDQRCSARRATYLGADHRWRPCPLTGALATAPISLELIVAELAATQDIQCSRPSRRRDCARGAEHALTWAQHATRLHLCHDHGHEGHPVLIQRRTDLVSGHADLCCFGSRLDMTTPPVSWFCRRLPPLVVSK